MNSRDKWERLEEDKRFNAIEDILTIVKENGISIIKK